jgi:hypothetical protein
MPGACCTRGLVCNVVERAHTSIQVQPEHSGIPCARERMGVECVDKSTQCGCCVHICVAIRIDLAAERNMGTY